MKQMIDEWRHVFKLDPDKVISNEDLDAVCMSGTDAVMIGGSSGVTYDNTVDLLSRVRQYEVPCVLEISELDAVVPGFDLYMIPMVLNTPRAEWIIGRHQQAIERYGYIIPWDLVVPEGYIILNPESTAAKLTGAIGGLSISESAAYAQTADKLMSLPVIYMEYSGTFGDMELVSSVRRSLSRSRLFYGGGITDTKTARLAADAADTIIVGNIIYTNLAQALTTVSAVKDL
ncbi:heptaprenylglyceryl phosphate synthase [Paenibacillus zeisoli]|uniref:Heptaprenylglyceryl phosphate synthase n=2 Tax=Paenibacillus zeisoli TaxID=2496267 RepID=A0A433XGQ3_9BACL|nr:heptaprenylglyceryl phosphate synthase [Paenibacillus zeisoli]